MRFDGVQPARVGRCVRGLNVVSGHKRLDSGVLVGVEVIHDHVEADLKRVAGAQSGEDGEEVIDGLAFAHLAHKAVSVDIVEGKQLFCAMQPPIGRPEPLRMANGRPASSSKRPQFKRATLVEADDSPTRGAAFVEVENAVFFDSNSGSGDCFHVFVCW